MRARDPSFSRLSILLGLGTAFVVLGQGAASPVLPAYTLSFGVGAVGFSWTVAIYALGRLLVTVPTGLWAGHAPVRLVLTGGCAITALGVIGTGLAPSFEVILACRLLAGVGSGIFMTSAILTLVAQAPAGARARVIGVNTMALLGTVSVAPALGGFLGSTLGLRASFIIVGGISAFGAVMVWALLPWSLRDPKVSSSADKDASRAAISRKSAAPIMEPLSILWPALIVACLVNLMVFATRAGGRETVLPLIGVERFSMSVGALGLWFTWMSVISLLVLPLAAWAGDRFGRLQIIVPALLMTAVGLLLCASAATTTWLWIGSMGLAAGSSLAGPAPAAWAADVSPAARHGATLSAFRTAGDVGSLIGPLAMGAVSAASSHGGALVALSAALVVLCVVAVGWSTSTP